ncbi:NAD(P)H-hydrate dehydratase [Rhodoferax sp.]|uniref:NAD(P)H-hydrate dehydratase n=1 Tax=Rhodoferax sp. TaxID=50421 RepID=UPI00284B5D94|nr:NAD(P)H-hydrate dehydratase [Rhodoferax sp.]MDR3371838.1 NAD(P)H-hydrate dehydratase [Rhodoferax sp.]
MNFQTALLDVQRMGEADRLSVAAGTPVTELMGNAGISVTAEIERRWSVRPVTVLCGPGNNGGDGFATAWLLAEAGWPVRVALLGARDQLTGAALHYAQRWQWAIEPMTAAVLDEAELVVDALFGAGLSRALEGAAADILATAAKRGLTIVAIDVPSGVMGDTGEALGAVAARLTVTFFRKKPGHLLQPGRHLCGEVVVADIGTPESVFEAIKPDTFENDPVLWAHALPLLQPDGNKYTRGHALLWGGWPTTGAARMAARAAARMGAGLTTIAVPEVALPVYAAALTSIMVSPVARHEDLQQLLADRRYTGLLIGPGAGIGPDTLARVLAMLATGRATVLDADALTTFENDPPALDQAIIGPCVITPHDGEFRRLFDASGDKLTRARAAARRCGAVVILKGSDTVIAAPDGRAIINANAPPTLATAGAGDVLGGMVLGLMTQGMEPFLASAAAVWLHGAAAADFGPGLMAEDLPDLIPGVLRRLVNEP